MKAYPMSATLMDGISVFPWLQCWSVLVCVGLCWSVLVCGGSRGRLGPAREDGADVTGGDDEEQHTEAGDERRVLGGPADHRAEQVDAVVARHRGRALDRRSE